MRRRDHEAVVKAMRDQIRYLERQNDELLNRLAHAQGNPWLLPPLDPPADAAKAEGEEWISDPGQLP